MEINEDIDTQLALAAEEVTPEEVQAKQYEPVYKVYENTKIAVSKQSGAMWRLRYNEVYQQLKNDSTLDKWEEVVQYYKVNHGARQFKKGRLSRLANGNEEAKDIFTSENIVFSQTSALVPAIYAKNPDMNITSTQEDSSKELRARLFEKVIDTQFSKKHAPGLNLKAKMRRLVVTTSLTNIGYLELSYTKKEDSSEQAATNLQQIADQLEKAEAPKDIQELEGQLQALEERVNVLSASGPKCRFIPPSMVLVDPTSQENDLSDANWIMVGEFMRTDYLRAVYGKKNEDGTYMSIYKPTHVLQGGATEGNDNTIEDMTSMQQIVSNEPMAYGYTDQIQFAHNSRTLVWHVWDKITRRVYMFNHDDWEWPIWVWEDPYKLSRFFPIFALSFYIDPEERYASSEVMYYLDQQDEVNSVNNERARMRYWAANKVFVDSASGINPKQIDQFLHSETDNAVMGIDLGGRKLSDVISAFPLPSMAMEQLFNTAPLLEMVNRLSCVGPVMRNIEFKTNTTNKAIASYESSNQMRLDEKIDAIEDLLSELGTALLEMDIQFLDTADVEKMLGSSFVQKMGGWQNMSVEEFNTEYNFNIVGGSTLKPTAKVKKDQAIQLGQILGQFANASPMVVVVMLKMMQRAFGDDLVITDEEWNALTSASEQAAQQQAQGGQPQQGGPQQGGQQQPPQQGGGQQEQIAQAMMIAGKVIDSLPPQVKQQILQMMSQGMPAQQVIQQLIQSQGQQGQQQPSQQPQPQGM